jgi:hypothetical protein
LRTKDRPLIDVYPFALYVADNSRFSRWFIDEFHPDDRAWRMSGLLECAHSYNGSLSNIPIGLDPYKALDQLALKGDKIAIKKALAAPTDGYVAEYTTNANAQIVARFPHTSLRMIETMTEAQRSRVICYNIDFAYNKDKYDRFLSIAPASAAEKTLLVDLNRLHRLCTTTARTQ